MMDTVIYDRLNVAFRDVFDEDDIQVTAGTTAKDIEGWDSLSHIQLILAVSRAFSVSFSASEIGRLKTVGELVALIKAKTGDDAR